ncbi:MAG: glycosyltransferase family 39 protein [Candidatus Didemnitutus sp.]|nr:glycosyltransferase family 39 protein [Candidatus Didemnitutus sp.]
MRLLARIGFVLLLLAATWLLRSPGLDKPVWNVDEAVTFTMAEQIRQGAVPYRDAVDQRTPLVPYAQAAVFAACGDWNLRAQHVALIFLIAATATLVLLIARSLDESETGVIAALFVVLLCYLLPTLRDMMPAHTAWYLIFFSSLAYCCLARGWSSGRRRWGAASGAAFGLAWLAKQPAVLDFAAALTLLAIAAFAIPQRRRLAVGLGVGLLVGAAIPVALAMGYFATHGAWADYVYYTWTYNNTLYVPDVPRAERWATIRVPFDLAMNVSPGLVALAIMAAVGLLWRTLRQLGRASGDFDFLAWMILGWSAAGLFSTTLSGRGFSHYSIQLIPGLSLACGWLLAQVIRHPPTWAAGRYWRPSIAVLLLLAGGAMFWRPVESRFRHMDLPEPTIEVLTALIRQHSRPEDRIHVWGYNPEIYAVSRRLPATRFLYNTFVTGMIPWTNLDPQKNTDYAVVPGSRDQLLADWRRHPPALVIDSGAVRGFLKYPLHQQSWLWPEIAEHYVEIASDELTPRGYRLLKRLDAAPAAPFPERATASPAVQITSAPSDPTRAAGVTVRAPIGTQWIELYCDEVRVRRMRCANEEPAVATFHLSIPEAESGKHRVQALAVTATATLASARIPLITAAPLTVIGGPPLHFGDRQIPALASSTITGGPILPKKETPHRWDAHAPARLVYPWQPGMNSLAFAYGIEEFALAQEPPRGTDGVEVVVQVEESDGRIIPVYRHYLDRELARRAHGHTVAYTPLPSGEHARIVLLLTPGPLYDLVYDWSYWLWVRADRSPLALMAGATPCYPERIEAPAPLRPTELNGNFVVTVGTPATIEFGATPGLGELSGSFGLHDAAWRGSAKTGPVDFQIELARANGERRKLFEHRLDPVNRADDRGLQAFRVALPQPVDGVLRFTTRSETNPALAAAFWGDLHAATMDLALHGETLEIPPSARSRSDFGFQAVTLDDKPSIFAHVSTTLVYPWCPEMGTLEAGYGLLPGAYAEGQVSDGAQFVVESEDAQGARREIFRRFLDPSPKPADRGTQTLRLPIPPLPGGHLILRTVPAPSGRITNAWSFWSDLRVKP